MPRNIAAIIEFTGDKDKGNKRGAIGRVYAEKQREKEQVRTEIIDNLKALPKKGNEASINPYPKE